MARGARRGGPDLSRLTPYEKRVFRRIGMLPSEARARGISLAAARGHAPRRLEPGGERIPEHILRDIRRRERGEPTEAERRFLRKQVDRYPGYEYEELQEFLMMHPEPKRDRIRQLQAAAERLYRASRGKWKWINDAPADWGSFPLDEPPGGGLMFYH